jgi:hypothetical protein
VEYRMMRLSGECPGYIDQKVAAASPATLPGPRWLEDEAERLGLSISEILRRAVELYFRGTPPTGDC